MSRSLSSQTDSFCLYLAVTMHGLVQRCVKDIEIWNLDQRKNPSSNSFDVPILWIWKSSLHRHLPNKKFVYLAWSVSSVWPHNCCNKHQNGTQNSCLQNQPSHRVQVLPANIVQHIHLRFCVNALPTLDWHSWIVSHKYPTRQKSRKIPQTETNAEKVKSARNIHLVAGIDGKQRQQQQHGGLRSINLWLEMATSMISSPP